MVQWHVISRKNTKNTVQGSIPFVQKDDPYTIHFDY